MSENTSQSSPLDSSRRQFIKTAAVAGTALGSSLSVARSAHAAGSDVMRIGVIGLGGRGKGAAGNAMSLENENVKLVAVGDAFRDRLEDSLNWLDERYAESIDIPEDRKFVGFDAYQRVLECDIDYVILATPPGFRPLHFEAAIDAGKHVFMEKPVAVDAPGIRRVLAAGEKASANGLAVGVGLQRRHDPKYQEAIARLHDGVIGDIGLTRVYWNSGGLWVRPRKPEQTEMEYQMRNWYYFTWLCGDHIVEQHIHNMDVSNWAKQMVPTEANGMGGREVRRGREFGHIYDHHFVEFTYPDGSRMMSQCRHINGCWSSVSEHFHGTNGTADFQGGRAQITVGNEKWRYRGPQPDPYEQEHADLIAAIKSGSPYNEAEYGAHSTMTAILGRMATYSGKVIKWDDAINSNVSLSPEQYTWDAPPPILPDELGHYPVAVPGQSQVV